MFGFPRKPVVVSLTETEYLNRQRQVADFYIMAEKMLQLVVSTGIRTYWENHDHDDWIWDYLEEQDLTEVSDDVRVNNALSHYTANKLNDGLKNFLAALNSLIINQDNYEDKLTQLDLSFIELMKKAEFYHEIQAKQAVLHQANYNKSIDMMTTVFGHLKGITDYMKSGVEMAKFDPVI